LAVFDDDIRKYFATTLLLQGRLWIGLMKSWWIWPDAGYKAHFIYHLQRPESGGHITEGGTAGIVDGTN